MSDKYQIAAGSKQITTMVVVKRTVTLAVDDINVVYGSDTPTNFTINVATGSLDFVASDNVERQATTEYNKTSNVGKYPISVTTTADENNYEVVIPNANVVVSPKEIVANITLPTNLVYDALAKVVEVSFQGVINDDVINAVISYNGEIEAVDAGNYTITVACDSDNYVVKAITTGNTFTITPAELKFSVENGHKGYGSAKVEFEGESVGYTYEGEIFARDAKGVNINVVFDTLTSEEINQTYNEVLYVSLSGAKAGNYTATTVKKGNVTIVANKLSNIELKSESNVYDATNHNDGSKLAVLNAKLDDFDITYSGNGVTNATFASAEIKDAGTYTIKLTLKAEAEAKYDTTNGNSVELTYTINKRVVELVATDKVNVTYGDAKPADKDMWTYADGSLQFVDSDNVVVTVNNAYTNTTNAGADIAVTFSTNAGDNYEVVLPANVKMNISKRALTATFAQPADLTFDNKAKAMGVTLAGMVNGDQAPAVTITYNGLTEAKNAGEYAVVVSIAEGNYTIDATTTMTISARELTLDKFALPTELGYDKTAKTATATFANLPEGVGAVDYSIVYKQNGDVVDQAVNAGDYTVELVINDTNYTIAAYIPANFTITKKDVTAVIEALTATYTGSPIAPAVTFNGVVDGDSVAYTLTFNDQTEAVNAGEYAVALTISDPNYNLAEEVAATLTITKADQTLTANGLSVLANYNKLTINGGKAGMQYKIVGGEWQDSNVIAKGIKAESSYTVVVRLVGDDNHNASNEVTLSAVKTGVDPTPINAKLGKINSTFGFEDVALMKEIEAMLSKIAEQDMTYIDNAKLSKAKAAYTKFVDDVNTVVNEAQMVAGKTAGRNVGAAAAAATAASVSILGVALAIAKKKMLF